VNVFFSYDPNHDAAAEGLKPAFVAWLPDRQIRFTRTGLVDARERPGHAISGIAFHTGPAMAPAPPETHRLFETECLTLDGEAHTAWAYELKPELRDNDDRQPSDHSLIAGLFIYGTLLRGESRHHVLQRADPRAYLPAHTAGVLLDLGEYPGLSPSGNEFSLVHGELVQVGNLEAFRDLDEIEEFYGFGRPGSMFRRALIRVRLEGGARCAAWTYLPDSGAASAGTPIASGDWRKRSTS
jgi:gamma-glutamylcyclotransferase (GGCT)/AIG2-like uncharacterized protein YtfP